MSNFQRAVTTDSKKVEDSLLSVYRALDETRRSTLLDFTAKLMEEQTSDTSKTERLLNFNRTLAAAATNGERVIIR